MGGRADDEGHHGDTQWEDDVEVALTGAVGVPSVEGRRDDAEDVRRACEEQRDDVVVAQGCDNGGEEVSDGGRGDDAEDEDELMGVSRLTRKQVNDVSIPESRS